MIRVTKASEQKLHHPKRHAAIRTREYIFSQLIPYIGNKRKLLHLINEAVQFTGCKKGTFVDLFTGSTVVARWAKKQGFKIIANDWEPYSYQITRGVVAMNSSPSFEKLGGHRQVFEHLNSLPPLYGYIAKHLCPADDDNPDPQRERMFFTRANGQRIDAIREQLASWQQQGILSEDELAYLLAPLIYAASYASNTSGVFKGFHNGWGGKTHTALYRILGKLTLTPPVLFDNSLDNIALQEDSQQLAGRLSQIIGSRPDIVYIDPPYNQHPYASNYHVLNTIVLWDKPPLKSGIQIDGKIRDKSAIRKDWRTQRRSPYNHRAEALSAFRVLLEQLDTHWALVSYSTDGNIAIEDLLTALAERGDLYVFTEQYKRYRVSTPRMSARSHNIEFVAVVNLDAAPSQKRVREIIEEIHKQEASIHVGK